MKTEIASIAISASDNDDGTSAFAVVGDLILWATHIQNRKEIVVTLNPNPTNYSNEEVEVTWSARTGFRIFDIHRRQTHTFSTESRKYEIEFLTWSRPDPETVSFDFEVRYEE